MTNMRIWDALKKTDPAHTKEVGFGRKFTSIDAQWQLQRMTEQFGPVGTGWGYTCMHSIVALVPEMHLAVVDVTIWWREKDQNSQNTYGPIRATAELFGPAKELGKMRLDDDAPKKAMTDALTKGLSHLGLSADVFLGMYDDNKYVQKLRQEFAAKAAPEPDVVTGAERWFRDQKALLETSNLEEDVTGWQVRNAKALAKLKRDFPTLWDLLEETRVDACERIAARA